MTFASTRSPSTLSTSLLAGALIVAMTATPARAQDPAPEQPAPEEMSADDASAAESPETLVSCWVRDGSDDPSDRPSPMDSTSVVLEAGTLKVCYGSPRMRGREIMGGLVPFDRAWRLGANEATSIHLPAAGEIAGIPVAAGSYSLFAIPGPETWDIVVNGTARRWGLPISAEVRGDDIGAATLEVGQAEAPVENLRMTLSRAAPDRADLVIEWETTRVVVPISLE